MESHNLERLKSHIIPLSVSHNFDVARQEWDLVAIEISEEFDLQCGFGRYASLPSSVAANT
jgi:hypothetical protein